ncbi:MAG: hypothetical protein LC754_18445 [Acidobacteria bacterium]|nr:hypothetical protein [Acidobacteriota bacterium]
MKRLLLLVTVLLTTMGGSCQSPPPSGNNANYGANGNLNANQELPVPVEKNVNIVINTDSSNSGKCVIADPGETYLSKMNKDKIKWCITNNCTAAVGGTVTISDFKDKSNASKKNPFGDGSAADNAFDITQPEYDCKKKTKDAASGETGVHYKYTIKIKADGTEKGSLDPEVEVGN